MSRRAESPMAYKPRSQVRLRGFTLDNRQDAPPLTVLLLGLLASFAMFLALGSRERERHQSAFERSCADLEAKLRAALNEPLEVLQGIPAFSQAIETLPSGTPPGVSPRKFDSAQFTAFVTPALARHPTLAGLEYADVVAGAERVNYEREASTPGHPFVIREPGVGGAMVPAAPRDEYVVLRYLVPWNEMVAGLELGFAPNRRALLEEAMRANGLIASERFTLVEDPEGVYSVAVYAPRYREGAALATAEDRRRAVRGFAIALFRLRPLVERALSQSDIAGLGIALSDVRADRQDLLYENVAGAGTRVASLQRLHDFPFAGRSYRVRFVSDGAPSGMGTALLVLVLGVIVSTALAAALRFATANRSLRARAKAAEQLGQYILERKIGEGGMGSVYRAHHAMMRRPTAVKLLKAGFDSPDALARFEREVKATASLSHPNTVAIYDYGSTPDGVFYYAMELLRGVSLQDIVQKTGPMPIGRALRVIDQVAGALVEAHAAGMIHRDLKPANIMLCERGGIYDFAKVLDFGLVKVVAAGADPRVSRTGGLIGTPLYMAPETVSDPHLVTTSVDVYALGAVLYFLLTRTECFDGDLMGVLSKVLTHTPAAPSTRRPGIPAALDEIVLRCLEKIPRDRPPSVSSLRTTLRAIASSIPPWTDEDAERWWRETGERLLAEQEAKASAGGGLSRAITVKLDQVDVRAG